MYHRFDVDPWFKHDLRQSMIDIQSSFSSGSKILIVRDHDGEIIAWTSFVTTYSRWPQRETAIMEFFCTETTQIKSYRCTVLLFNEMCRIATAKGCHYAIVTSHPDDTRQTLPRMLETIGWERRGHTARKQLRSK